MTTPPDSATGPAAAPPAAAARPGRARPWLVPVLAAVLTVLLGAAGLGTSGRLANGGYTASGTESDRADALLAERFGTGRTDLTLLVRADDGDVDDDAAAAQGLALAQRLARSPGVTRVRAYWTGDTGRIPVLRSADGSAALVTADLAGADRDAARTAARLVPRFTGRHGVLRVSATGPAWVSVEAGRAGERDLVRAELVAAPLTLLVLVVALRSLVAALVPLVIGAVAVVGTFALLRLLTFFMPVSVFAVNLTSALGFGLAVDYGLFLVTRYREELRAGLPVDAAVRRTARIAGRTVAVSAGAVGLSMSALLVLPLPFLRSMACAGTGVAVFAAVTATVLVPPVLVLLGTRVDRWDPLAVLRPSRAPRPDSPAWRAVARAVTARPLWYGTGCAALLLVLAAPFGHVRFGLPDERILPAQAESYRTSQDVRENFAVRTERNLTVVLPAADPVRDHAALQAYERAVTDLPGVARTSRLPGTRGAALVVTGPDARPQSAASRALLRRLRALPGPGGGQLVTGRAAVLADTCAAVRARLPLVVAVAGVALWGVLFLLTGSVLLPVKALGIGALSLGASFGAMVFVFQDGHLRGVLGQFAVTGMLDMTMPLLMSAIAVGLAVDYEIFLLSRVKEHYVRTRDNRASVVEGVARTGRLVSTSALAVAVVTGALATSGVTVLKLLGTGLATAVLVDAVLVRGVLVPAYLALLGRVNWWAPGPLRRVHGRVVRRVGLDEGHSAGPR
ncbi:MMPL family transporter [Streptomyces sp. NPDC001404]|uniref:MMPL family transporter n=1 Tax=Streptomyces sp. NPDC001404 TaxID=3364571 RepID=UPI0036739091